MGQPDKDHGFSSIFFFASIKILRRSPRSTGSKPLPSTLFFMRSLGSTFDSTSPQFTGADD